DVAGLFVVSGLGAVSRTWPSTPRARSCFRLAPNGGQPFFEALMIEHIVERWPALANPATPIPPPPYPAGRYYVGAPTADVQCDAFFDPVAEFARAARGFRLR